MTLATTASARGRSLETRIAWLQDRAKTHKWICQHGNHRWARVRWHCQALVWTKREIAQAVEERDWTWEKWLPDKWARVGACETGYGQRPGNWSWDSGRYVSAFGIIRGAYTHYAHQLGFLSWDDRDPVTKQRHKATPWEQYKVAEAIEADYGFGAWGCGGA